MSFENVRSISSSSQLMVLAGLTGFAISQPVLSIAGGNPSLFVFENVSRFGIVTIAVAVAIVPPVVLWLLIRMVNRANASVASVLFVLACSVLALLAGVQLARELSLGGLSWLAGLVAAAVVGTAIARSRLVVDWLSFTAVLPLLAIASFLLTSETSDLLGTRNQVERNTAAGVKPTVVMVVLDELPVATLMDASGDIDRERFPNLARLRDEGTWYSNYSATASWTGAALPSMLSGLDPASDQPIWKNHPDSVFSLFAPTHRLVALESFTDLCGYDRCNGAIGDESERTSSGAAVRQLFDLWLDRISGKAQVPALDDFEETFVSTPSASPGAPSNLLFPDDEFVQQQPQRLVEFVDSFQADAGPSFHYLHMLLPHVPYRWFPSGTQYAIEPDPVTANASAREEPWVVGTAEHRFRLQAMYTDSLLGVILDGLDDAGLYDQAAVIVVADHGLSFVVGEGHRDVAGQSLPGTAYVPLFVKAPGQTEGLVDLQNLQAADLISVVAEVADLLVPWPTVGGPPGSEAVLSRGSRKTIVPAKGNFLALELGDPVNFDMTEVTPESTARVLPIPEPGASELGPLLSLLDSSGLIGTEIEEDLPDAGRVEIYELERLTTPAAGVVQAFVQGALSSPNQGPEIYFAVDDVLITGSKVFLVNGEPQFLAMLPSDVAGTGFEIRAVLVQPDGSFSEASVHER